MQNEKYVDAIQQILEENNLSQQKFADIIGVNQTAVSKWLLGKQKPGYDSIKVICKKFNIEPNELFDLK